jgi:branched-chain amino acid transport system permease protein
VRDNPERVEFVGYSTQRVRYLCVHHQLASSPASPAGMYALNFEIATAEVVGRGALGRRTCCSPSSGGAGLLLPGPIIGAVLMVLAWCCCRS